MKKLLALILCGIMIFAFAACSDEKMETDNDYTATEEETPEVEGTPEVEETPGAEETAEAEVMSYEQFCAAELQSAVTVETYIQAKQGWWEKDGVGVATFYTENEEGAYFIYEMPCSKEDYDEKLVVGAKILVNGYKAEWEGEVEIIDATYEVLEGEYIAQPVDVTEYLGTDELIGYQNRLVAFKGLTVEAVEYKNGEPGDDIYLTVGYNGASYDFCVECYLTGPDTEVYAAAGELEAGDVVDVEGFAYWYQGINTHVTSIASAE